MEKQKTRAILHSDANCFYASCEMVLNPSLRGKAVAVCGSQEDRHGIVLAKSEKAKKCGITTGMTNKEALSRCPELIIVSPRFEYYSKFSKLLHEIYARYTDLIEPFGLDECWLDVTDSIKSPMEIAEEIRQAVKDELGLTVSIGVSFNKVFAKLGSDMKKPDAITEITKENFKDKVWTLPCSDLLYCGRATTAKLEACNILTIGALATMPKHIIESKLGKNGGMLWDFANGLDNSPVAHKDYKAPPKSISHGITCVENLVNYDEVEKVIIKLCQDVGYKLRQEKMCARGVSLTVKDEKLNTFSFQERLEKELQDEARIAKAVCELFKKSYRWFYHVRAVTVGAISLTQEGDAVQIDIFNDCEADDKRKRLYSAIDQINDTYGKRSIQPATVLNEVKTPQPKSTHAPENEFDEPITDFEAKLPSMFYRGNKDKK